MPIAPDQIKFWLSGGSENSDIFQSIGGAISMTTQIKQDEFNNLWGDIGSLDLKSGVTQYRAVYMKNESNNTVFENPRAWFNIKDPYTSIQWTKLGVNKRVTLLPNERTAPPAAEVGTAGPTPPPPPVAKFIYPSENVTASSTLSGAPGNTNDQSITTGWLVKPPAWLSVDLGVMKYIHYIKVRWVLNTLNEYDQKYTIETSNDGITFTNRATGTHHITGHAVGEGTTEIVDFKTVTFGRHNTRHVRITAPETTNPTGNAGIGEFEVWGTPEVLALDIGGWEGATEDLTTTQSACPNIPPLSFIGLWLRRTIPPDDLAFPTLKQTMKLEVIGGGGVLPPTVPPPPAGPGEGCIPEGWYWPDPRTVSDKLNACGDAIYSTWTVEENTSLQWWFLEGPNNTGTGQKGQIGEFEIKDNANAYLTYLKNCSKPRCDGGSGGSGTIVNGIKILNVIDSRGKAFSIVGKDFTRDVPNFERDDDGAAKRTEGGLTFWRFESRNGSFASGGSNRTNRPEWNTGSSTRDGIDEARNRGTIGAADDPRDIEVTYIVRVHNISDSSENWSLKCRGNGHSDGDENTLTMSFGYPYSKRKSSLYDVEISHPSTTYRNVNIRKSDYMLPGENKWIGIKNVIYNINNNQGIHCDCYVDEDPIIAGTGNFRNNWVKVWDYEESRNDTPVWAGPAIQLRVDQVEQQDVAAFEVVSIIAPKATAAMTNILPLNIDINHSEEFTIEDGDIMYND